MSGPAEILGTWHDFPITPRDVAIVTWTTYQSKQASLGASKKPQEQLTRSSMFPYLFFFMPEALKPDHILLLGIKSSNPPPPLYLVATHPPSVLNSTESGSCPIVNPSLFS